MRYLFSVVLLISCLSLVSHSLATPPPYGEHTILFYNTENLFDTIDRVDRADDEFLPESDRAWTSARYWGKIRQVAEVISRAGETSFPTLVGLAEVENALVLGDLARSQAIANAGYRYVVTDSSDPRGSNVGLLYRPSLFELLEYTEYQVSLSADSLKKTRNILHVLGRIEGGDLLNVLVCHLPSRRGGARASEAYRRRVGQRLRAICDSLYREQSGSGHFIIMGDFNATPKERTMRVDVGANTLPNSFADLSLRSDSLYLFNLFAHLDREDEAPASYCYRRVWEQIDQIIVSQGLLAESANPELILGSARNFSPNFLRQRTDSWGFPASRRTYLGTFYQGGTSDHYPILIKLLTTHSQDSLPSLQ